MNTIVSISLGDPGGIGPEIVLKSLIQSKRRNVKYILFGSFDVLSQQHRFLGSSLKIKSIFFKDINRKAILSSKEILVFDPTTHPSFNKNQIKFKPHKVVKAKEHSFNGQVALDSVCWASHFCLKQVADVLVTAPLNKTAVKLIKPSFLGHTEYLQKITKSKKVSMMFVSESIRLTLATIHVPLSGVSKLLSKKLIKEKIQMTHQALRKFFGIKKPKIAVSCLNPHGDEFGVEEKKIIEPAIRESKQVPAVAGPIPGDEIFRELLNGDWDAIISMYHDQGLAPFKALAFDSGVNLTLGLPFVRTSPDHGTAFDIAYKNKAQSNSMLSAINLAVDLHKKMGSKKIIWS